MTKYLMHKILCDSSDLAALIPIIESHCQLTDSVCEVFGSSRAGSYSAVIIASNVKGKEIRELIEAHTVGDYEYKVTLADE